MKIEAGTVSEILVPIYQTKVFTSQKKVIFSFTAVNSEYLTLRLLEGLKCSVY
jgi:hypothetical protein